MKYLITIAMILIGTQSFANNVVPVQHELRPDQVEWLNTHRADTDIGEHNNFVYYRTENGHVWSASLNEYKKSSYFRSGDLLSYFQDIIDTRLSNERLHMVKDLKRANTLFAAMLGNMDFEGAYVLTQSIFEGFYLDEETGAPSYRSDKYDLTISLN